MRRLRRRMLKHVLGLMHDRVLRVLRWLVRQRMLNLVQRLLPGELHGKLSLMSGALAEAFEFYCCDGPGSSVRAFS